MMKRLAPLFALLVLALAPAAPTLAQTAKAVTTCPASVPLYTAGNFGYPAIDINGNACSAGGGGGGGGGAVFGPTANGSPAANPPVLIGGTLTGGAAGTVENAKVDASGNQFFICSSGCSGGGGGGSSQVDEATFTQGTSSLTVTGCFFSGSIVNLTSNQGGAFQCTNDRMLFTNLGKVGGSAISLGQNTMANSLPVAIASNQSAIPANTAQVNGVTTLTGAGATGTGSQRETVAQDTSTIAGSAPGTAGTPSTNAVTVQGISGGTNINVNIAASALTNQSFNLNQVGGNAVVTGGVNGSVGEGGPTAVGSAFAANPLPGGGLASSTEPAAATTGHPVAALFDLAGKEVTSPYANRELYLRGTATTTGTGATTLIAAQGASVKIYVTGLECGRTDTGATALTVTLNDSASSVFVVPNNGGGGGNNISFAAPLALAVNTALTFTSGAGVTSLICSAQGYAGY